MTNLQALIEEWRRIAKAQEARSRECENDGCTHASAEADGARAAYTRCADDLEKAGAGGWIECAKQMPETDIAVLAMSASSGQYLQVYWSKDDQLRGHWVFKDNEREVWFDKDSMSHWMPRPSPPEKETQT